MPQQRRTVVSAWLGLLALVAPVTVACSNAQDVPVPQSDIVAVADVRAGSTGGVESVRTTVIKAKPVTKTVTQTVEKTRTVTQTKTVTAAPQTVRVTAPPTTVTAQAPATTVSETVTETVMQTETAAAAAQGLVDSGSVYFANCSAARAAGAAPVRAGDPGYRPALDRDGDGIGCE